MNRTILGLFAATALALPWSRALRAPSKSRSKTNRRDVDACIVGANAGRREQNERFGTNPKGMNTYGAEWEFFIDHHAA